jgi:hypothetical protein
MEFIDRSPALRPLKAGRVSLPLAGAHLMPDERFERAVEAAAKALHEQAREPHDWHWDEAPSEWKDNLRDFVRPQVEAALRAADTYTGEIRRKV